MLELGAERVVSIFTHLGYNCSAFGQDGNVMAQGNGKTAEEAEQNCLTALKIAQKAGATPVFQTGLAGEHTLGA